MDEASETLRMIAADVPDRERMYYPIDGKYDFLPDAKEFLDWKAATNRTPATMKAYCSRLLWYYRFLAQRKLDVLEATPADLTEFVIWLCNPYLGIGRWAMSALLRLFKPSVSKLRAMLAHSRAIGICPA